jgi:hypothetical protein
MTQGKHYAGNVPVVRCLKCAIVVKYVPQCIKDHGLCIICAIKTYPDQYTKRQKYRRLKKMIYNTDQIKLFKKLLVTNKKVNRS